MLSLTVDKEFFAGYYSRLVTDSAVEWLLGKISAVFKNLFDRFFIVDEEAVRTSFSTIFLAIYNPDNNNYANHYNPDNNNSSNYYDLDNNNIGNYYFGAYGNHWYRGQ